MRQVVALPPGNLITRRYEVERLLGEGGLGAAYAVRDRALGRSVCLKLLLDRSLAGLLRNEFDTLRSLIHPNLARVRDFGVALIDARPTPFFTSDLAEGVALDRALAGKRFDQASEALADVLRALAFLHDAGVRHGDVKPENLLVSKSGRATVIDLSCAAQIGSPATPSGTAAFMPGEVLRGEVADGRADLFAFGRTLELVLPGISGVPARVLALTRRLVAERREDRPDAAIEAVECFSASPSITRQPAARAYELVGRAPLIKSAGRVLDAMVSKSAGPRIIEIVGESGSGRTRVLREITWACQLVCPTIEVFARDAEPMTKGLSSAADRDGLPGGALLAVAARDEIVARGQGVVIVIDDADRIDGEQRDMLDAFVRLIGPLDPILLVQTLRSDKSQARPAESLRLVLDPLSDEDVALWVKRAGFESAALGVVALARGHAGDVATSIAALARGVPAVSLARHLAEASSPALFPVDLEAHWEMPLALIAVARSPIEPRELSRLVGDDDAAASLLASGLVRSTASGLELARPGLSDAIVQRTKPELLMRCHELLAERARDQLIEELSRESRSVISARLTLHLSLAGRAREASDLFQASIALVEAAPRSWLPAAEALLQSASGEAQALALARVLVRAGEPKAARELVRDLALRTGGADATLLEGECSIELGDAASARALLERFVPASSIEGARRAALLARALIRLGAFGDATAVLAFELDSDLEPSVRADICECAGVAAMYTGDLARARRCLTEAAELLDESAAPRRRVRAASYRAILAFREGDLDAAERGYRDALAVAEKHGLADQLARCSLNFGTACHQRGDIAEATSAYARGEALALALDQPDLILVLMFNAAKLHADAGSLDRAEAKADAVIDRARRQSAAFFVAAAQSVLGDVAFARGDLERAREQFDLARRGFLAEDAKREVAEEHLELGRVAVAAGRTEEAEAHLLAARAMGVDDAADLRVRAAMLSAKLALTSGDARGARTQLADVLRDAERAHLPELSARALMLFADVASTLGATGEAAEQRARARSIWTKMTLGLSETEVVAFFRRPERAALEPRQSQPLAASAHPRVELLERLVASFRKLNASLETADVLRMAMDEAIDLTGAERGFLLLAQEEGGELTIAVARNVDKASLDDEHLRFSRSIAERAIRTAEPVLTVDAQSDARFRSNVSVHAMGLRSVIAVPIRSPSGVLGALYLDNRYKRARFGESDADILLSFADQVAIALRNATRVEALESRGVRLQREGEALRDELELTRAALESRFDYSSMIGKSVALRRVLALLDRVIDSPLSVLVTGESGTGKELVARAIHFGSRRKDAPFVGINCAALPSALLESELFGHTRGAFTGADRDRVGLVVAAKSGTLFLDELGEMPLEVQAKLLRVLQEREVRPVGSSVSVPVDFRLVCATNRDLRKEALAGRFREDLFYRVGVVEVLVPPLRERLEDLPDLVQHFVTRCARDLGRPEPRVTIGALRKLLQHDFPGNVRELENLITKAVVLADEAELRAVDIELPRATRLPKKKSAPNERELLQRALEASNYSATRAALDLAMPRATFYRRLAACGLDRPVRSRSVGK